MQTAERELITFWATARVFMQAAEVKKHRTVVRVEISIQVNTVGKFFLKDNTVGKSIVDSLTEECP